MIEPVDRLNIFLKINCPHLTINDVKLSAKPGYIEVTASGELINIQKAGYGKRKGVSINQLWIALHDYFNSHVAVAKSKSGMPTVIVWGNKRYIYDHIKAERVKG